ncbi:hypothetical protein MSMTP_1686 [Methanosarcina sp. MTP4]|nr:hypothetical protein MSMTP_1686 [Methanosarcina sp. MTP4]
MLLFERAARQAGGGTFIQSNRKPASGTGKTFSPTRKVFLKLIKSRNIKLFRAGNNIKKLIGGHQKIESKNWKSDYG